MMTPKRYSGANRDTRPVPNVRVRMHRKQSNLTHNELARLPGTTFIAACCWDNGSVYEEIYTQGAAHLGSRLEPVRVEERVSIWREVGG